MRRLRRWQIRRLCGSPCGVSVARRGRCASARVQGRCAGLEACGACRRLAWPSGHGSTLHEAVSGVHRCPYARFIEDLVAEQAGHGVGQYVILGAGLDTFAQRRPEIASALRVFEIDRSGPQAWKRKRLIDLGFGIPGVKLKFVPVDFEAGESWRERLVAAGFDAGKPAVIASTGVSMYLTRDANAASLRGDRSLRSPKDPRSP